ncbi:MAG TPA: hypothetical protein VK737_09930 [Opitutales bacterium]|jgi:hypothetical protein|nr:hypothetical protein [Opitutales bacterium]
MSDNLPVPDGDPGETPLDPYDLPPPLRTLTPEQQARAARAQLILFIVMGIFIIAPFIVWWVLNR